MNHLFRNYLATAFYFSICTATFSYASDKGLEEISYEAPVKAFKEISSQDPIHLLQSVLQKIPADALESEKATISQQCHFENTEVKELLEPYKSTRPTSVLMNAIFDHLFKATPHNTEILPYLAAAGHPDAQYELAMFMRYEEDAEARETAKLLIHQAAAQGHALSLYELSECYESTPYYFGLTQNRRLARLLCEEAGRRDHEDAQYSLAAAPLEGKYGVKKNFNKGKEQLKNLAEQGNQQDRNAYEHLKNMKEEKYQYMLNM